MAIGWNRPTKLIVNQQAIVNNIRNEATRLTSNQQLFAVVKADGYGHGALKVMEAAEIAGVDGYCVAILDEAIQLREYGCTKPIIVMGVMPAHLVDLALRHDISLAVASPEWFEELATLHENKLIQIEDDQKVKVHIKIDSGMGRIGLTSLEEVEAINQLLVDYPLCEIEGIFTHFATADSEQPDYFNGQVTKFNQMLEALAQKPRHIHVANSATGLWHEEVPTTLVRFGIAMYGLNPSGGEIDAPYLLEPAMSLETELVHVKQVEAGTSISYGATYTSSEKEWIGTLPIGYADGWRRSLQGFSVIVEGEYCEIVGRICMDQCMIRLSRQFSIGTKVTLIGHNNQKTVTMDDVAHKLGTINYEVSCDFSERIPRYYQEIED